ncbi:MAG TPA: N-acetyl-gamma-glutamyl-phosphate reductase [Bacteroidota bacterium]|nr:N-acetyl-gamma-glutamyl-phosphate reductase [Bacteroidota bacterium]
MLNAAIIGASGYSGAELLRVLSSHPGVRVRKVTAASSAGLRVDALYPAFAGQCELAYDELVPEGLDGIDVAFVALPSGEAMKIVPHLKEKIGRVVDLGGDFRLRSPALYEKYYRRRHTAPELLADAVYGLPEINRDAIAGASLVANPGCYPTAAILALLPALKHGIIHPGGIVINALSGVSGAGRSASVDMSFAEINENVRAYKIGAHQHIPEIETILTGASEGPVSVSFVPHLIPITRGIYTTAHAGLAVGLNAAELLTLYEEFYASHPFVRVTRQVPQILAVSRTNFCDIALAIEERTNQLIVMSVIDNLVKGAAGQAVQNMNLMFGLPETTGLK